MQAYATAEPISASRNLRVLPARPPSVPSPAVAGSDLILDELLARLADLVAAKLAAHLRAPADEERESWLDTQRAAEYLGVHRDTIRRLAAKCVIPAEQTGAGCKLFFRRRDLDRWRRAERLQSVEELAQGSGRQ
jgi:excisionase family DNA binding protein